MFNPNFCQHNIRIATRFAIAYAVVCLTAFLLAIILPWIIIQQFAWLPVVFYLACLAIMTIASDQLERALSQRALWKKYYQDATTDPTPRVKRPACAASIFGSNNTTH